jgi:cysteine desulfurase/selenocysteine lyase
MNIATQIERDTKQLDVTEVRKHFPILQRQVSGRPIVYLDSAATSLKPRAVIDAIVEFYERYTANINRGVHVLGEEATDRFEEARETVASFINADVREIVFVRNTTEAINLVAHHLPRELAVLYGLDAHHSNILPWRQFDNCQQIRVLADGRIDLEDLQQKLRNQRPEVVAVTHVSNALGAVNPIDEIVRLSHEVGAKVLVDASQSVPHRPINVRELDCDYLCFSGHKMCGPTGIGVLYGRRDLLNRFSPLHYGGDMVEAVHVDDFQVREIPWRLEAGTPYIEGAIGLAAACDFLESIGLEAIHQHEEQLVRHALDRLPTISRLHLHGPTDVNQRSGSVSFTIDGVEAHGVGRMLSNRHNICVRSGYHCAQPAHETLGVPPTVRASFYLYNHHGEIDALADALDQITANLTR